MAKSKTSKRYTLEFRQELVALHRAGRSIPELSREFGPTPWTIALWVEQADRDAGHGDGGLTTNEREELATAPGEQAPENGAGDSFKSRGLVRAGDDTEFEALFGFVRANQDTYPVDVMCRLLRVSKSGFYAWVNRPMSVHARTDVRLTAMIRAIHEYSHATSGAPRVHAELVLGQGMHVARIRVARLMPPPGSEVYRNADLCARQ